MTDEEKILSDLKGIAEYFMELYREEEDHHIYDQHYDRMVIVSNACNLIEELLKEQEPRVLTLEETEACEDSVWLEKNIPEWGEPIPVLVNETNKYLDTFTSRSGWRFQGEKSRGYGEYGKTWRCWSARPTDEQRKAVPWEK